MPKSEKSARARGPSTTGGHTTRGPVTLLVSTRKGLWTLKSDSARERWRLAGPHFLGQLVHHAVLDPRDGRTLMAAVSTGHLGPTVQRSEDGGRSWTEAERPPAFPRAKKGKRKRSVGHVFWLRPGHPSQPDTWWAGTSPQGLFRSKSGGRKWKGVAGFNDHPMYESWTGGEKDGTPDGPKLHSILIDPRDADHMYLGCSGGGVFETTDGGKDWSPLNRGCAADFLPTKDAEYGHDPHCMGLHPLAPDVLYQQNHCGIYRMDRAGRGKPKWVRIGKNMPEAVGDVGFPIVLHPRDPDTAWVFPMDGTRVWPRTAPGGKPAVYVTRDGGGSWRRQATGLPRAQAWFSVKRQCMAADAHQPLGLYFGTSSGEIWTSARGGTGWHRIAEHLPHVYSVEVAGRVQ
jgi:photosystem II stability/assembly factor-like uncharacterized protein